jgi:hypothetical protein
VGPYLLHSGSKAAARFLSGDTSVEGFLLDFRRAMNETTRPLRGSEVNLFDALSCWEDADPEDRPALVERLRTLAGELAEADH